MKILSVIIVLFALIAERTWAEDLYRLKDKVEISTATISLADLIDGPDVPKDPLFGAPAPGKTGTIQTSRIIAAFKRATGKTLPAAPDKPVMVTRRSRMIAEQDVARALAGQIARDFKIEDPEIRLQRDETIPLAVDERASGDILITNLKLDPQSLRFEADMSMTNDPAQMVQPVKLRGYVTADRLVPVITRAVEKGVSLSVDNIRMERRLRSSLDGRTVPTLAEIRERVALMPLAIGDVLTDATIGKPQLVEKGAIITVTYEANGLLLTMRGRATDSGAMGDVVGFSNPQSKKILFGTVSGENRLRVTSASSREARLSSETNTPAQ